MIVVVLLVLIPVGVLVSGAVAAALLGWGLEDDGEARYAGTEHVDVA